MTGVVTKILDVQLEELGQRFWIKAAANTLGGSYGSAQFRFVARPPTGTGGDEADELVLGPTFPLLRMQDLDNQHEPNGWAELAHESLADLDRRLRADGWHLRDSGGRHWWSRSYEKTS